MGGWSGRWHIIYKIETKLKQLAATVDHLCKEGVTASELRNIVQNMGQSAD